MDPLLEKSRKDLLNLLKGKGVESMEQLEELIDRMVEGGIPEEVFDLSTEAEEMMEAARNAGPEEAVQLCRDALSEDPVHIPALVMLGQLEEVPSIRAALYKRGVDIGIDEFSGEFMEEHRGHFWMLEEARPYMLALEGYADALFEMLDLEQAVNIWMEMLELNTSDDQAVRYKAMAALAYLQDEENFDELDERFADDASARMDFNRALLSILLKRPRKKIDQHLRAGMEKNPHILPMLLAHEIPANSAAMITLGEVSEAEAYCSYGSELWDLADDACDHLKRHLGK